MNIIIGSDLVPTDTNIDLFIKGDIQALLNKELLNLWLESDYRVFNLEAPLVDMERPILKKGPNLIAPSSTINGIAKLKPSIITLANNHILDHDEEGLTNTINLLYENNIPHIGAGKNLDEAKKPFIIKSGNKKVGIYTCAEHEFTIAGKDTPGANPFDPFESLDHIADLKNKCDYVIVLYHGGKEYYRYPSPYLQKACRKMIDKGADLVICQHSHTIGAFEDYNTGKIVYGQGNFLFNKEVNEHWDTGLLIRVEIKDSMDIEYIPFVRTEIGIRQANKQEHENIMSEFYKRSKEILIEGFVEENYRSFAEENVLKYLRAISSQGKWLSRFDRYIFRDYLIKKSYKENKLLSLVNYIECEAHRELFLKGLKNLLYRNGK